MSEPDTDAPPAPWIYRRVNEWFAKCPQPQIAELVRDCVNEAMGVRRGHTVEAYARRCANYRRGIKQLQRAHLTHLGALQLAIQETAELRFLLAASRDTVKSEQARADAACQRNIEIRRDLTIRHWLFLGLALVLGAFIGYTSR